MAWRYRKRTKIAPGVYLNTGKNSVSTTMKIGRGQSITIGKNGTYLNTSIPGTGLYNRQRIENENLEAASSGYLQTKSSSENSPSLSGCTSVSISFLAIGLILIAIFCVKQFSWLFILVAIVLIVIIIISKVEDGKQVENKGVKFPYDEEILTAQKSLSDCGEESIKGQILQSYIACLEISKEIDEAENILQKLKSKNKPKYAQSIIEYENRVSALHDDLENARFWTEKDLNENAIKQYERLCESFLNLGKCEKIWDFPDMTKPPENPIQNGVFKYLKCNFDVPVFIYSSGVRIYIYPNFIIKETDRKTFNIYPITSVKSNFDTKYIFDVDSSDVPLDCGNVSYHYMYENKNGMPDRRYAYNPRLANICVGKLNFSFDGDGFVFSDVDKLKSFCETFDKYKKCLMCPDKVITDKVYFDEVIGLSDRLLAQCEKLKNDQQFLDVISDDNIVCDGENDDVELVKMLFLSDMVHCYREMVDEVDCTKKESLAIFYVCIKLFAQTEITLTFNTVDVLIERTHDLVNNVIKSIKSHGDVELVVAELLAQFDEEERTDYLVTLYRLLSLAIKADGIVTEREEKLLSKILSFRNVKKSVSNSNNHSSTLNSDCIDKKECENQNTITKMSEKHGDFELKSIKQLDSLIGLDSVKTEIQTLTNFVKIQKARDAQGLKSSSVSYHCVFTGNPGTGKTTVARIVASIYRELGVLKKGHLVETDRSGLVAEYVGQTAVKTNKIIDEALDGVLFIDEAYSLISGSDNDYGKEAIATLLKRMEDDRDRLVVILAGYSTEMKQFIDVNPGLQSRFNRYIEFSDYSSDELCQIFEFNAKKYDYKMSEETKFKVLSLFQTAVLNKDKNFGNARFVRNVFEKTLELQANRLAKLSSLTKDQLTEIVPSDIPIN